MIVSKTIFKWLILGAIASIFVSFKPYDEEDRNVEKFRKLKLHALKNGEPGKDYTYNLTGIKFCNNSNIKYLGTAATATGKKYKILVTTYVFQTGKDMCHGASAIEIYDNSDRYLGQYPVGMPDDLPDELRENKLFYTSNSPTCDLRKEQSISLKNGLPKSFFTRCSSQGGNIFYFQGGN